MFLPFLNWTEIKWKKNGKQLTVLLSPPWLSRVPSLRRFGGAGGRRSPAASHNLSRASLRLLFIWFLINLRVLTPSINPCACLLDRTNNKVSFSLSLALSHSLSRSLSLSLPLSLFSFIFCFPPCLLSISLHVSVYSNPRFPPL